MKMKEYKSRKNRRKYSKTIAQRNIEERKMDIKEGIYYDDSKYPKKQKNKKDKIKKLYYNVECFISGNRSNNMVCCTCSEAKKIENLYNVKMLKKEPINLKYGLFMFQIVL